MKILLICRQFGVGPDAVGVEQYQIARKMVEKGYNVSVITMGKYRSNKHEIINGINVNRIFRIKNTYKKNKLWELIMFIIFSRIWIIKNSRNYNIMLCDTIWPSGLIFLGIKSDIKYIVQSHGSDMPGHNPKYKYIYILLSPFIKNVLKRSRALIVKNNNSAELGKKIITPEKLVVIENATEEILFSIAQSQEKEKKKKQILYLGRFEKVKGINLFLNAFEKLLIETNYLSDWKIKVAGFGNLNYTVQKICSKYENLIYVGYVNYEDRLILFKESSIFIIPSLAESGPRSLTEAMASGCAVISTNVGDVKQKMEDCGILIEPNNLNELVKAIIELVNDSMKIKLFGRLGRKLVQKFPSINEVTDKYLDLINKI